MIARQLQPDLIVLDIGMPGGGGFHVFDRLRSLAGTADVPFLIHSSLPRDQIAQRIPEGPRVVKLARSVSLDRIAIDLTLPMGAMAFTSVHELDADAVITERVRSALLWNSRG